MKIILLKHIGMPNQKVEHCWCYGRDHLPVCPKTAAQYERCNQLQSLSKHRIISPGLREMNRFHTRSHVDGKNTGPVGARGHWTACGLVVWCLREQRVAGCGARRKAGGCPAGSGGGRMNGQMDGRMDRPFWKAGQGAEGCCSVCRGQGMAPRRRGRAPVDAGPERSRGAPRVARGVGVTTRLGSCHSLLEALGGKTHHKIWREVACFSG